MELILFMVFVGLSLTLITLGFYRQEYLILPLIGFLFLFLLSFTLIGNDLQYRSGENTEISYTYSIDGNLTSEIRAMNYTYLSYDDTTSEFNTHRLGYFLGLAAGIGMIGVFVGYRRSRKIE